MLLFISNTRLKLAKDQASAKQHLEVQLLLFEIIHIFHSCYHLKTMGHMLKNKQKSKCGCIHEIIRLVIMKIKVKLKNKSHIYIYIYIYIYMT